jgi:bacillithiol system protein YtxJ
MNWIPLNSVNDLDALLERSFDKAILIFKHSTTCSISKMALNRIEREDPHPSLEYHLLDLLQYRHVSNTIAEKLKVHHESPQILLIKNGDCVYDQSHNGITVADIAEAQATH